MSTPATHKIADTPPVFPCWLYTSNVYRHENEWVHHSFCPWHFPGIQKSDYSHWCHSETRPTVTPEAETTATTLDDPRRIPVESAPATAHVNQQPAPQLPAEVREAIDWMEHAPDTRNVTEDWKSTHQRHIAVLRDYFANKADTATDIQTFAPSPQSTTGKTVSHADAVEISQNDRENKVNTELNAAAEHLFSPENFDGVGLAQSNADVEKVAEEIAAYFSPSKYARNLDAKDIAAILRRYNTERDAEMKRRSDTARETCRQAWTDAHEANARAEKAEAELAEAKELLREVLETQQITEVARKDIAAYLTAKQSSSTAEPHSP